MVGFNETITMGTIGLGEVKPADLAFQPACFAKGLPLTLLDELATAFAGPMQACQYAAFLRFGDLVFVISRRLF